VEINPSKIIRDQGLCNLVTEGYNNYASIDHEDSEAGWVNEADMIHKEVFFIFASTDSWYNDLKYFLVNKSNPSHLNAQKRWALRLKASCYQLINDILFIKNFDNVLLRCLEKDDAEKVIIYLDDGLAGGHYNEETTTHKILRVGYYWKTLFKDAHT